MSQFRDRDLRPNVQHRKFVRVHIEESVDPHLRAFELGRGLTPLVVVEHHQAARPHERPREDRIGQRFTVTGPAPEEDYDREEVGRMWSIRFKDGTEITAWPEEVERDCIVNGVTAKWYSRSPRKAV